MEIYLSNVFLQNAAPNEVDFKRGVISDIYIAC